MEIMHYGDEVWFEWDSNKAERNRTKHQVDFFEAAEAYEDYNAKPALDDPREYGEDRERIIGRTTAKRILLVVYVERREYVRIISAREADENEKRLYFEY